MKTRTPKQNKSDLLKSFLQSETDLTPQINEAIFNRFFDLLEEHLKKHQTIELRNFGVSDPRNKAKIYIPSKWKVAFKASESINKRLNEKI
jgi:nucleoid DNA-binding protein